MPEPNLFLLPHRALEGPRRLTLRTRPRRVCFLVDPHDRRSSLAAINSACVTWGGRFHFIVPCQRDGIPESRWNKIIETQDPDVLVDLVGVSKAFSERHQHRGRAYTHWQEPWSTMVVAGSPAWASLDTWKRRRRTGITYRAYYFDPIESHEMALPLAFRFGHHRPRSVERPWQESLSYLSARLEDFVDVQKVDPTHFEQEALVEALIQIPIDPTEWTAIRTPGQTEHLLLPQLTSMGLPVTEPVNWDTLSETGSPRLEGVDHASWQPMVVVGQHDSIADLCLAWNLRAQRAHSGFLVVWIQPTWMSRPEVRASFERALSFLRGSTLGPNAGTELHLFSASMTCNQLAAIDGIEGEFVPNGCDTFDQYFTDRVTVGMDQDSVEHFFHGTVHVKVPNYDLLGDFRREDKIAWTLSLDSISPPRIRARGTIGVERAGNDGFIGSLTVGQLRPGDTISLHLPPAWTLVEELLSEVGYRPEVSDKGRLCIAVSQLFEGAVGLNLLASSRIYALLRKLASIGVRQAVQQAVSRHLGDREADHETEDVVRFIEADIARESQFDRHHFTWSALRTELGGGVSDKSVRTVVNWMIEHRIIFRGYEIRCPVCGLRRWYAVDRLAETYRCDGCQSIGPLPIEVDTMQWRYRLNEVIAQAVDQGVLPHLLALKKLYDGTHVQRGLLGVTPGMLLQPLNDASSPLRQIEVDLFALERGMPVIGECKSSASLTTAEVGRFADLGKLLGSQRIIYAAPADLPADVLKLAHELSDPIPLSIWNEADLLDPTSDPNVDQRDARAAAYLVEMAKRVENFLT